jgi:hypothetical protein
MSHVMWEEYQSELDKDEKRTIDSLRDVAYGKLACRWMKWWRRPWMLLWGLVSNNFQEPRKMQKNCKENSFSWSPFPCRHPH